VGTGTSVCLRGSEETFSDNDLKNSYPLQRYVMYNNKETNNGSNKRTTEKGSLPGFLGNAGKEQEVSSVFASLLIRRCNTGNESKGTVQSDWLGTII